MLDPGCGDGRFLALHRNSTGVEQDGLAVRAAAGNAPWAKLHECDLFTWATRTEDRFDAVVGNPPFIRYQRFAGAARDRALQLCESLGAPFSSLTSSWAPFLVAAASLLKPGGRMAVVVPAEIGHAPYAVPLLEYLLAHFATVQIVPVRERVFAELSEDCWLLYAAGFGERTSNIRWSPLDAFAFMPKPPEVCDEIPVSHWRLWNNRLRPFLVPSGTRELYRQYADGGTPSLGAVAKVGIGYVTGANDFFHLRPSQAERFGIPDRLLHPTVRSGGILAGRAVTPATVRRWLLDDEPALLLKLSKDEDLRTSLRDYLDSEAGLAARQSYKCRNRDPWYVVPDVTIPDLFLSYMCGAGASLVANDAKCVCTNSVHAVRLNGQMRAGEVLRRWEDPLAKLSCELEGHPLGGGMLKVEPREAARVLLPKRRKDRAEDALIAAAARELRRWRHYV